ncbi:DUF1330 domain-containing protein [Jannaschia sp. CCS1]|uniref:DUF1330 domain-containing protein n=1 Tax=Jannaschia sp. (strain CCS1) TaxID=290400 RepID=UPI000053DBBD|nr:DUF1330 domain-containing protein [Jannaschia sp. CCS1]ABD53641.1 protein of unknown function DUF1330 [Jannaschia sp. CCS1]
MLRQLLSATAAFGLLTTFAMAQDRDQPIYLVASLDVTDLTAYFDRYGAPVFPMLAAAGAEVLVGTPSVDVLEGDYGATWTAIVRFPSMAALDAWYASPEYQAIAPERRALTEQATSLLFAAPAFVTPDQ